MAPPSPDATLSDLLLSLFSADELRRFLRYGPGGDAFDRSLPAGPVSPAALAHEAVLALRRVGGLDQALFDRLEAERPRRAGEIRAVRDAVLSAAADASPARTADYPDPPSSPRRSMPRLKVLFVAANPATTTRLNLDEELRDVQEKLRASEYRDAFEMIVAPAARPDDLQQALLQHRPTIVHFSGHGSGAGGLVLQGTSRGTHQLVNAETLGNLFRLLKRNVRVVMLNACYSEVQADAVVKNIDFVVGMNAPIGDKAARVFAASFYRGLGFGESVETAFELGLVALSLEGLKTDHEVPVLRVREGASAGTVLLDPR